MPSLFLLPAVQLRLQAPIVSALVKPSHTAAFRAVVTPLVFSTAIKRAQRQRQSHVCQAAGKNEPKFDENDYITASVEAGARRAGSACFRKPTASAQLV